MVSKDFFYLVTLAFIAFKGIRYLGDLLYGHIDGFVLFYDSSRSYFKVLFFLVGISVFRGHHIR